MSDAEGVEPSFVVNGPTTTPAESHGEEMHPVQVTTGDAETTAAGSTGRKARICLFVLFPSSNPRHDAHEEAGYARIGMQRGFDGLRIVGVVPPPPPIVRWVPGMHGGRLRDAATLRSRCEALRAALVRGSEGTAGLLGGGEPAVYAQGNDTPVAVVERIVAEMQTNASCIVDTVVLPFEAPALGFHTTPELIARQLLGGRTSRGPQSPTATVLLGRDIADADKRVKGLPLAPAVGVLGAAVKPLTLCVVDPEGTTPVPPPEVLYALRHAMDGDTIIVHASIQMPEVADVMQLSGDDWSGNIRERVKNAERRVEDIKAAATTILRRQGRAGLVSIGTTSSPHHHLDSLRRSVEAFRPTLVVVSTEFARMPLAQGAWESVRGAEYERALRQHPFTPFAVVG